MVTTYNVIYATYNSATVSFDYVISKLNASLV